jgi:hypothetical protein
VSAAQTGKRHEKRPQRSCLALLQQLTLLSSVTGTLLATL